jgi:hypothetical protein
VRQPFTTGRQRCDKSAARGGRQCHGRGWEAMTLGTRLLTWFRGESFGADSFGNRYRRQRPVATVGDCRQTTGPAHHRLKRSGCLVHNLAMHPVQRQSCREVRFAADSPVEGEGFEPSVPRETDNAFRDCPCSTTPAIPLPRQRTGSFAPGTEGSNRSNANSACTC